ncbi:hypothetical protein ACU4GD_45575 [Cupriavidus basilensis]
MVEERRAESAVVIRPRFIWIAASVASPNREIEAVRCATARCAVSDWPAAQRAAQHGGRRHLGQPASRRRRGHGLRGHSGVVDSSGDGATTHAAAKFAIECCAWRAWNDLATGLMRFRADAPRCRDSASVANRMRVTRRAPELRRWCQRRCRGQHGKRSNGSARRVLEFFLGVERPACVQPLENGRGVSRADRVAWPPGGRHGRCLPVARDVADIAADGLLFCLPRHRHLLQDRAARRRAGVRSSLLADDGSFDHRLDTVGEPVRLCRRARRAGDSLAGWRHARLQCAMTTQRGRRPPRREHRQLARRESTIPPGAHGVAGLLFVIEGAWRQRQLPAKKRAGRAGQRRRHAVRRRRAAGAVSPAGDVRVFRASGPERHPGNGEPVGNEL